jgi:SAM-dependent methyltransferase
LARAGFDVTATDYSLEAITRAKERFTECGVDFQVVDMTERLPFGDQRYDAVMSNVAAHMFSDEVTRRLLAEVKRVLRHGGLLLLHVNSDADRELRAARRPVKLELEPNYVLEESGQTVRFFSGEYLRSVLADWRIEEMTHVEILNSATGRPLSVCGGSWRRTIFVTASGPVALALVTFLKSMSSSPLWRCRIAVADSVGGGWLDSECRLVCLTLQRCVAAGRPRPSSVS